MSTSSQPQFRYTQTPSKVLHLRNLPWECAEEELVELCKPFGKIVNTKCNVGANRNQAFVEFADLNQAISMVSYYASSSEPAQIRGKTVYIQYSNRHEIVNNKSPGDTPGNVLLVTIEGVEPNDVTIETIHLVFSAFGFVHKIATFEKAAGFQALIQFTDAETASSARNALDGRSIPRYLLPDHVTSCYLRISYSAHTDLNIKFQSHRSRDYTNPYLPVNPTAMEGLMQPVVGPDGKKQEPQGNVLLASIENMQYAVTVDVLHTVFSAFGTVQKIAIFEKNGGTQALIQYPDITTAAVAKESLEGHCIYDGGYCKLHLSYSRHTDLNVKAYSDKSRDYTISDPSLLATQVPGLPAAPNAWQNPQGVPVHHGTDYSASAAIQGQPPAGQVPAWDPNFQARPPYGSVPGQTYQSLTAPTYVNAARPAGSSPHSQPGASSMPMQQQQQPPWANVRQGGAAVLGQPPYYSR
ncbi:polypyrimidine tract-binding protein-like protein 1-like isoform X1 [Gossypium australe]|uniref:Polypyrimidine tract-binding protein-like protein 1-like isoform X1 n=1 Tax=Gossypium australe TaxID=47621 RepID=A0A5B6V586_9ROSI|nr:polypyrimidine tract-binding protein-like protein 1-like isoform X1 [Gossypium australe]